MTPRSQAWISCALLASCLCGCDDAGPSLPPPQISVTADAQPMDAQGMDALGLDEGLADARIFDQGRLDLATLDARSMDAGRPDAVADMAPLDMAPRDMAPRDMAPGDMAPPDAAPPVACPTFDDAVVTGNVADPNVVEASGVVESRRTPGVLWMHNDSGDGNRVFAVRTTGERLGVFQLNGGRPRDWEDLAIGPGPGGQDHLYLGDVGDNLEARANIRLRRFPEPAIPVGDAPFDVDIDAADAITLVYPDGAHDCETLLVDPRSGDVVVVVKSADGDSPVYRAPAPLLANAVVPLEHVADLQFGVNPLPGNRWTTGGDISPSGDAIVIRTYTRAFLWRRAPGASVAEALATEPCPIPQAGERQGESIGFAADGDGYYTVSEGPNPPIHFYRRR